MHNSIVKNSHPLLWSLLLVVILGITIACLYFGGLFSALLLKTNEYKLFLIPKIFSFIPIINFFNWISIIFIENKIKKTSEFELENAHLDSLTTINKIKKYSIINFVILLITWLLGGVVIAAIVVETIYNKDHSEIQQANFNGILSPIWIALMFFALGLGSTSIAINVVLSIEIRDVEQINQKINILIFIIGIFVLPYLIFKTNKLIKN